MIPKLRDLIEQPVTLVMGAGASKDYGFPLWAELRAQFASKVSGDGEGAQYWRDALSDHGRAHLTLDALTLNAKGPAKAVFQRAVAEILVEGEAADRTSGTSGWIEALAGAFLELSRDEASLIKMCSNVTFVTLNYERCFAHRFGNAFWRKLPSVLPPDDWERKALLSRLQKADMNICTVLHCHGALGILGRTSSWQTFEDMHVSHHTFLSAGEENVRVTYGDRIALERAKWRTPIISVDFVKLGENSTYASAHSLALNRAAHVVFIGLSPDGLSQSALKLSAKARIFCTGTSPVTANAVPVMGYASELVTQLVRG